MNALYIISGLGVLALFAEIFNFRKYLSGLVLLGLLATLVVIGIDWDAKNEYPLFNNMLRFDRYAYAFTALLSTTAFLWMMMAQDYLKTLKTSSIDQTALILFSLAGGVLMVSFNNLVMLFIGIEIVSISMYAMAGSNKTSLSSTEAAIKYFIMGAFMTGVLLFGIALVYGATASFDLPTIAATIGNGNLELPALLYAGILLILIGMAFKVSAVPFHFWAPDVYEGTPTTITAFMSTLVKTAAFAAFFRLFSSSFAATHEIWAGIIWGMIFLTLLIGNISAVYQSSVKRMLAYSSIAHVGFLLMTLLVMNEMSASAVLYYATAYSVSSIAAFMVVYLVAKTKNTNDITAFRGLFEKNPILVLIMTIALLSLAGIPPLAGFFAKYYIFSSTLLNGRIGLVLFAVVMALVGVYYYFKVIIAMFQKDDAAGEIIVSNQQKILLLITALLAILLGVFPDLLISLI